MESEAFSAQATLAHYWDDAPTDTLTGVKELPTVIASQPSAIWNGIYCVFATVAIYWVVQYAKASLRSRREKIAQLELRRRHGIPDSDTRPFNIAYHAASIAARDAKRQSMSAQPEQQLSAQNTTSSTNVIEGFRPQARARPPIPSFPGQPPVRVPSGHFTFAPAQPQPVSNSVYGSTRGLSHLPHSASTPSWGPGYDADGTRATSVPTVPTVATRSAFAAAAASGSRRSSGVYGSLSGASERRTWSSAARPVPTSHSTGNLSQARVRKRLYLTADEEEAADQRSGLPNDKRSRTAGWGSEAMIDGDNEPLWAQSYPVEAKPAPEQYEPQTGKTKGKRLADDADGDLRIEGKRRHTKSKSHRPKPSTVQETRGTKRERKDTDTASALNDVMPVHKRGRAGDVNLSMVQEEDDAEEEDDPTISRDPLCGGRRIGQKWTANGQEYMVGANGERLRFVTVKESRKRYYMPADSKHADSFHMIDVFVEKWLNEEQYAKAKADGLLAWQENENLVKESKSTPSDKAPEGKENQNQEERPRSISTTAITVSRAQRAANTVWNTPGQSPLTSHPMSNPFNTPPSATTPEASGPRRIRYSMGTLPPTSTINRSISVWEKQEKEAAALKILRERRKAEAAKATPAPTPAPVPAPAPVTIPSFTVTAPSETTTPKVPPPVAPAAAPAPSVKAPSFSFAPAAPKAADPAPVPASAPAPAASNPFSFAPKKDEAPKPLFPTAPAAPASAPAPVPSLFSAPAAPAPSTTSAPSPFAAPVTAAASPFGGSTPAAPNKPSPFAFGAPSTTVQPAAPAPTASSFGAPAAPPTAAPSAPSPFGQAPVAPSPAATKPMGGFTFGPTPSTTPAASSAPAPSPFGAPAPKPAANTFSFNTGTTNTAATTETKPTTGFSFGSEPKPTPGPATGGFGNTVGSSNVFGNGAPKATNAFGSTTGGTASTGFGSGFGGNNGTSAASSSLFGGNKPATTPATSGFGTQPSAPAFGAPAGAAPASTFKFGDTNGTAAPATASGFQFGAPKPTLSIPTTNSFGAPPSATPTATNGNTFTFGASTSAPTPAGAAASPATPSKPMFNLGAPAASPVMGTRQISTSKRVQRAMSKPPQ